jgi:hypothetical protein
MYFWKVWHTKIRHAVISFTWFKVIALLWVIWGKKKFQLTVHILWWSFRCQFDEIHSTDRCFVISLRHLATWIEVALVENDVMEIMMSMGLNGRNKLFFYIKISIFNQYCLSTVHTLSSCFKLRKIENFIKSS